MPLAYKRSSLVLLAGVGIALAPAAWGSEMAVPLQLQVELSKKILEYVDVPPFRSVDRVRIGIVVKADRPDSVRAGGDLKIAFDRSTSIAGHDHEQSILEWSGPNRLVEETERRRLTVLYFTPGLDVEVAAVARALVGKPLLRIAAVDSLVQAGAILGFDLVSGHPKMLCNLRQAKAQGVVLKAAVLKLMRIVE